MHDNSIFSNKYGKDMSQTILQIKPTRLKNVLKIRLFYTAEKHALLSK
jgi:hypothetical protein